VTAPSTSGEPPPSRAAAPAVVPGLDALRVVLADEGAGIRTEALVHAMTHRSYAYEQGGPPTNERLEFLGDAVLGLVVTDALFRQHPLLAEGQLAKLRASVVNMHALAGVARAIGLGEHLLLGRGEEATGGRDKPSILADSLEALLGTVYLEAGLERAARLIRRLVDPLIEAAALLGAGLDWKTSLQELAALGHDGPPDYAVTESGPDHAKHFVASVVIGGHTLGEGAGATKKQAEQRAAETAYAALRGRAEPGAVQPAAADRLVSLPAAAAPAVPPG